MARLRPLRPARLGPGSTALVALWLLGTLALGGLGVAVVLWARTRPGYDPYGWLVWGKLTVHGRLDTNGAPSWKPLPYLATVPFALAGSGELWLWMVTSVAVSLAGFLFAGRIAAVLVRARIPEASAGGPPAQAAVLVAGVVAAVAVLGIRDYTHFILSAQSDTMVVSLCLAAIDCGLRGRRRWALWLWLLAALGRPEAWPFLGAYCVWAWSAERRLRPMILIALALVPLLWFGIPAVSAKSAFIAGDNALNSPRELHGNRFAGTLDRFLDLHELPVWVAALVAVGVAALRRHFMPAVLAAGALVWVAVEVAFVLHGYPGVPRYLFEPAAVVAVLAGLLAGQLLLALAGVGDRLLPRVGWQAGLALGVVLVLAFGGSLVGAARSRVRIERQDLRHERSRARLLEHLRTLVARQGGSRILRCGSPDLPISYQSIYAWYTGMKTGALYVNEARERVHPAPLVVFTPAGERWRVTPVHIPPARAAACRGLKTLAGG